MGGTPPRVPPPSDLAGGYPDGGVPDLGYPPVGPVPGGYPDGGGVPQRVVLDTPRSVCPLRSRRRTFLSVNLFQLVWSKRKILPKTDKLFAQKIIIYLDFIEGSFHMAAGAVWHSCLHFGGMRFTWKPVLGWNHLRDTSGFI